MLCIIILKDLSALVYFALFFWLLDPMRFLTSLIGKELQSTAEANFKAEWNLQHVASAVVTLGQAYHTVYSVVL